MKYTNVNLDVAHVKWIINRCPEYDVGLSGPWMSLNTSANVEYMSYVDVDGYAGTLVALASLHTWQCLHVCFAAVACNPCSYLAAMCSVPIGLRPVR